MSELIKATEIDGVAATEDRDSQNEVLLLDGADIAEMTKRGYFNDNHGSGFMNTLGRITHAKKIYKEEDADDARQKNYWEQMKRPFLYVKGYLFDEGEHPNAKAVASIMKEFKKMGTPLDVQMSVEGKVKQRDVRDPSVLKESAIRNVALTLVPANSNTGSQIIKGLKETIYNACNQFGADPVFADSLCKSITGAATIPRRNFIEVVAADQATMALNGLKQKVKQVHSLVKALAAGYGTSGAPASRADGATVQSESVDRKRKKLASTTWEELGREKRKSILKALIKKTSETFPSLSYEKVVELSLQTFEEQLKGDYDVTKK